MLLVRVIILEHSHVNLSNSSGVPVIKSAINQSFKMQDNKEVIDAHLNKGAQEILLLSPSKSMA